MTRLLGVDVGGTKCLGVALDDAGRVVSEVRVESPAGDDALLDALCDVIAALGPGDSVGVGLPGLVDRRGVLRAAPNLPGVVEFAASERLTERLGRTVIVDNDATCAALAEWRLGAGVGVDDLAVVTLGTGIGGGLVVGGRLEQGADGLAGEVGHMIVQVDGRACGCGRRGCWERYASGSALADHAKVLTGRTATGEQVVAAARDQQPWALEVVEVFASWVAIGLANLANVTDPARFVIGGGLADTGDVLLGPLRSAYRQALYASSHRQVADIVMAELGPRAGAIGAALLGSQRR